MPLFTRRDREAVGTAGMALALVALMLASSRSLSRRTPTTGRSVRPLNGILVTNAGSAVHNFNVQDTSVHTKDLQPGETANVELKGLKAGELHRFLRDLGQLGMQATLVVGGSGSASSAASGMENMDFNGMSPQQLQAMNDRVCPNGRPRTTAGAPRLPRQASSRTRRQQRSSSWTGRRARSCQSRSARACGCDDFTSRNPCCRARRCR